MKVRKKENDQNKLNNTTALNDFQMVIEFKNLLGSAGI